MNNVFISRLSKLQGVRRHCGLNSWSLDILRNSDFDIPEAHKQVLSWSNGIETYGGYFRLFGINCTESIDAIDWNSASGWKFAWGNRCSDFWCFGETAWGDQYAYNVNDLHNSGNCAVYFLDAISMAAERISDTFAQFLENEFLRCAESPYDDIIPEARKKFGDLDTAMHLVYVPSLLLGGIESVEHVEQCNARAAMILNGDIALQLDELSPGQIITAVNTYVDQNGITRLSLLCS